ncbi:unnamed protein product [Rhizopus stolonifer]
MSSMSTDSNATHKSDLELATDIGRGLLSEINRMRTVLQEKQESLSLLEATRWENEQKMHELYGQLTHKCELETRYKEDIGNLEITKQSLTFQISQLKTTIRKLQSEHHVQQNKQNLMQRELETLKCSQKNLQTMTIRTQIKHETTLFELNQTLERLRSEKQILLNQLKGAGHEKSNELDCLMREAQETIENVQQGNQDLVTAAYDGEHTRSETDKDSSYDSESIQEIEEKVEQVKPRDIRVEDKRVEDKRVEDIRVEDIRGEDIRGEDIREEDINTEEDINAEEEDTREESKIKEEKEDDTEKKVEKYLPVLSHTMAGERLNKYVRHPVKAKFSNSHSRYFWLHPFTKTLYWSENKPEHGESKLKSMPIQSFSIIKSTHQIPIICIQSFNNQMKIHCSSLESFSKWSQSLECLFMKPVYNKTMNRLSQLSI